MREKAWPPRRPAGGKPRGGPPPLCSLMMTCGPRWKAWLRRYAEDRGLTMSDLVERAMATLAERDDYAAPPGRED